MKPNLFNYATSELSQDAFLLWLLEWANPSNSEYDPELHLTAKVFLRRIIDVDDKFDIKSDFSCNESECQTLPYSDAPITQFSPFKRL